ncbi:MAG: hypothetical protein EPN22_09250 [Nitrospirae bacterium]|nr:MAG: hypothetical protein EPN22_09250 [Nitrospirota bacterium]
MIIESKFRTKFFLKYICIVSFGLLVILLLLFLGLPKTTIISYGGTLSSFSDANKFLPLLLIAAFVIDSLTIPFTVTVIAILASHKIAGPIYRMQKFINDMAEKRKARPLRFRNSDQLHETADALNTMIRDLESRLDAISAAYREFEEARIGAVSHAELKTKADKIEKAINKISF